MKFTFKDITNKDVYGTAKVLFIFGPYNIFNNIAIDAMRELCKPPRPLVLKSDVPDDFEDEDEQRSETVTISNSVDIATFMQLNSMIGLYGTWFCSIDYTFMTKKQKDWLKQYIKAPSKYARLVVYCHEFRDYATLLRDRIINNSKEVHVIQLSFPYRQALETVVRTLFEQRGVHIEQRAIELFIMRMSNSYDEYEETIDKIIVASVPKDYSDQVAKDWKYTITYDDALNAMKGIENFVLDDFIERLLIPMKSDKTNGKNKIYRMLAALEEEFGAQGLVNKLRYKIDDYIEFRVAINSGKIPIKVRFSVDSAKKALGDDSKIVKYSDYTFRRMANIASQTSLRDWTYMRLILNNTSTWDKSSYERVLYSLINRSVLTESRLNNDIGIDNIMRVTIKDLDTVRFSDKKLLFAKDSTENDEEITRRIDEAIAKSE